jgi:hypothetical protein
MNSNLDPDPNRPDCATCHDLRYLTDRDGKNPRVCPTCSCATCERLKYVHPDQGGCICCEPTRVIVERGPMVAIRTIDLSE